MDPTVLNWFARLQAIQAFMENQNHLTADDLKAFSQQKLGDLLITDLMKGNLSQFCAVNRIGLAPPAVFKDGTKTFLWFLNRISFSIEASLLVLFYNISSRFNPAMLSIPIQQFAKMPLNSAFGPTPLPGNQSLLQLHIVLKSSIRHPGFYEPNGSQLGNSARRVRDVIVDIVV